MKDFRKLIVCALAGLLLAACSGDGSESGLKARINANAAQPTPQAQTLQKAVPTETPDFAQAQPALQPTPQPVQQAQEIVTQWATVVVEQTVVVERVVEVTVQSAAFIDCVMLARTPMPTVALDAQDIEAGVVMRGGIQPCAMATAISAAREVK
jgi:hypothetical protein